MLRKYRQKTSSIISNEGIIGLIKKAIVVLSIYVCRINKLIIYELDLEKPIKKIKPKIHLTFRLAEAKDIQAMDKENYDYSQRTKKYAYERLDKGDRCLLALHKDKIVGYVWIMNGNMELSQFNHIPLPWNKSYIYRSFVLEKFRGMRIVNAMGAYISNELRKENKRYKIATISVTNKSSIRAFDRVGYEKIGHILQFRFLGLKYDYISKEDLKYLQNP